MSVRKIYVEMIADLFHYGHVEFLRKAKALGDYLVVGILSDEWAAEYKQQPVLNQDERKRVVEACRYVDEVICQPEPASARWIAENGFTDTAIAFKNDYDRGRHLDTSVGYDRSREHTLSYEHAISTTEILKRIEERNSAKALEIRTVQVEFATRWTGSEWLLAEQMLKDINQVFTNYGLPFFLTFGTLLGAARHQGVIPWDDDIDIAIFQQDETRLIRLQPELEKRLRDDAAYQNKLQRL